MSHDAWMLTHPIGGLMRFFRRRPSRNARRVIAYLEAGRARAR